MSNRESLVKLSLNTGALADLNKRQSEVNIFEILQVEKTEIRHSNILAWLLDPEESHGLGDGFLRGCIKAVITNLRDRDENEKPYDIIDSEQNDGISNDVLKDLDWWIAADFYKVQVERENDYKDIVITGRGRIKGEKDNGKGKFLIAIENKVKANEGRKNGVMQTEAYYLDLMNPNATRRDGTNYSDFKKRMFIFLTPNGDYAKDGHWTTLTYEDIIAALENAMSFKEIPQASAIVIKDYIKSIKKHITGDSDLIEICDKLLRDDYGEALNIILETRKGRYIPDDSEKRLISAITNRYENAIKAIENNHSDASYMVGQYIRDALRKISKEEKYKIVLPEKFNQKKYISFTTETMTDILGGPLDDTVSPWGNYDKYVYEFDNCAQGIDKTKVKFFLILGGGEFLEKDYLINIESQISYLLGARLNDDYTFKRCAIPRHKRNSMVFDLNDADSLEEKVDTFVREMIDEAMKVEDQIKEMLAELNGVEVE